MPSLPVRLVAIGSIPKRSADDEDQALAKLGSYDIFKASVNEADSDYRRCISEELKAERFEEDDAALGRMIRDQYKSKRWALACERAEKKG